MYRLRNPIYKHGRARPGLWGRGAKSVSGEAWRGTKNKQTSLRGSSGVDRLWGIKCDEGDQKVRTKSDESVMNQSDVSKSDVSLLIILMYPSIQDEQATC